MRILFFTSSSMWEYTLPLGFRAAGHDIKISGVMTEAKIPKMIREFNPDIIMSMGWSADQMLELQSSIGRHSKEMHVPNIYWSVEDPNYTETFTIPLLRALKPDFVFTICEQTIKYLNELGFRSAYLDYAYEPTIHKKAPGDNKYACSVAVVANAYPHLLLRQDLYRLESVNTLIKPLLKANIPVHFWGNDWDRMSGFLGKKIPRQNIHGSIPYSQAYKVYNSAKIVLGLQNSISRVTQRTFEILGSGGLLITSDTPGVRKLFKPDHDLIVTPSPQDTLRLVRSYLNSPSKRERIQDQGRLAVNGHTYKDRADYIIKVLKTQSVIPAHIV